MIYRPKLELPPPSNWQDFEMLCWSLWKAVWRDHNTQKNGRNGQPQHGVDVYGQPWPGSEWAGVQCKGKENFTGQALTETELVDEVNKAKQFNPRLSRYIIATTAPRDAKIQEVARNLTERHKAEGLFSVSVFAWHDIEESLIEIRPPIAQQWYPSLADNKGIAEILGRLVGAKICPYTVPPQPGQKWDFPVLGDEKVESHDAETEAHDLGINLGSYKNIVQEGAAVPNADIQSLSHKLDQIIGMLASNVVPGSVSTGTSLSDVLKRAAQESRGSAIDTSSLTNLRNELNSSCVSPTTMSTLAEQPDGMRRGTLADFKGIVSLEGNVSASSPSCSASERLGIIGEIAQSDVNALIKLIHLELSNWNYATALCLAEELERLIKDKPASKSSMPEICFLLARVHIIHAERHGVEAENHIERAKAILAKIELLPHEKIGGEIEADIAALKGSILNLEQGPAAALAHIATLTNPYAIRIRLAILIRKQELEEAATLIENLPPNERWCDLAVTVLTATNRLEKAEHLVQWTSNREDQCKYRQCVVRFADALLARALSSHKIGENILPHDLSEDERNNLRVVLRTLQPVLEPLVASSQVDSELSATAVKIAWVVNRLLNDRVAVANLTTLMYARHPVPLDVARSVISGYIESPADLLDRLRNEHPGNVEASILAAVVQSACLDQHMEAFVRAKELVPLADTNEKKEELFKCFQQLYQELTGDAIVECEQIAANLASHDEKLCAVFEAAKALRAGEPDLAIQTLDRVKAPNDSYWLQLRANAHLQKQQFSEAVDSLITAARETNDPSLLQKTADLAYQAEKADVAASYYERLLEIQPDNRIARGNLASIYIFKLHDLQKATAQFQILHEAEPDNSIHTLNLAICLAQLYRPEESLALYDEACSQEKPDIRAVLGRAEVHISLGRPQDAYTSLDKFRQAFWADPNFLFSFMNIAYAAGDEEAAHAALKALSKLQEAGEVDATALRSVPDNEAIEILANQMKRTQERTKYLHSEMLMGRIPWVLVEHLTGNAIYWGWRRRVHELTWIGDMPENRANFCIYATNAFHSRQSEGGSRELLPIECPPAGSAVVADITALITLHRLGLLDMVADYFGEIKVPVGYLPTIMSDGKKMVPLQASRKQSAERLAQYVNRGRITVRKEQADTDASMVVADEYGAEEGHCYHLIDLIEPVYKDGFISDIAYSSMVEVCIKQSGIDESHPPLMQLQEIFIEISTLETLSQFNLLDVIVGYYKVCITDEAHREILQRLEGIEAQTETHGWHLALWNNIRADSRFCFVGHAMPEEMDDLDTAPSNYLAFLASFVARDIGVPLLVDDRVCQALTLNNSEELPHASFGTAAVIAALMNTGKIDSAKATESILRLIKWRYRFLVPAPECLVALAMQYRTNPPGQPLREIAEYVHDCMRDAGLFGGAEKTDRGESMAIRLYLAWVNLVGEFLLRIWNDESFSAESAKLFTEWGIKELLPSPPRVLPGQIKKKISDLTPQILLTYVLINTSTSRKGERISDAMRALKEALKLSDEQYLHIVSESLNDI